MQNKMLCKMNTKICTFIFMQVLHMRETLKAHDTINGIIFTVMTTYSTCNYGMNAYECISMHANVCVSLTNL